MELKYGNVTIKIDSTSVRYTRRVVRREADYWTTFAAVVLGAATSDHYHRYTPPTSADGGSFFASQDGGRN